MGTDQADERDHRPGGEDPVDNAVELGGVVAVEAGGDLGGEAGAGEHLVPPHERTVDIEYVCGEGVDLVAGQPEGEPRATVRAASRAVASRSTLQPTSPSSCCQWGRSSSAPV